MTYDEFIADILNTRGRFNCGEEYHERHHIIPKCCGGTNDDDNLIDLFPREHFIAHKMLVDENPDNNGLIYAFGCMLWAKNESQERYEVSPDEYEEIKIKFSKAMSENAKIRFANPEKNPMYEIHRFGEENPMFGRHHSELSRKKIGEKSKERLLDSKNHPMYGKHPSEETIQKMKDNHADFRGEKHPMYGKHHTTESRKKMSISHKGKQVGKDNVASKSVAQYTLCGNLISCFESTCLASLATGVAQSSISRCANGKLKSAGGFIWKYINENEGQSSTTIA